MTDAAVSPKAQHQKCQLVLPSSSVKESMSSCAPCTGNKVSQTFHPHSSVLPPWEAPIILTEQA